jgi:hypothetical protein
MPYDELGNFIPGDETPSLDKMRYELSLLDTVKQMAKSPANDLSALTKAQTYKDIAGGFGSAAESLVRGAGAMGLGLTGDIIKHLHETPLIPGVTDKISLNDAFPGAETLAPAKTEEPKHRQQIAGLPYATSADILEAFPGRMTEKFGDKEANDFMESMGMYLAPNMQALARKGIINFVETTGKLPSLTKESSQAFARDYANAMNGVYPEKPTFGSMAADFAREGKAAAQDIGDVVARRQAMGKSAIPGVPDIVPETRMYAVKPERGGNWINESIEQSLSPLKVTRPEIRVDKPLTQDAGNMIRNNYPYVDQAYAEYFRGTRQHHMNYADDYWKWMQENYPAEFKAVAENKTPGDYLNRWVDKKLAPYVKNELATPNDPVLQLHERGISHMAERPRGEYMPVEDDGLIRPEVYVRREAAGLPKEGFAQTPLGQQWENYADQAVRSRAAKMHVQQGESANPYESAKWRLERNPWLKTIDPETPVYHASSSDELTRGLGFDHLMDELRNAIDPNSGLPANLRLKPEALDKVTVPQAIERVAKINEWRVEQMQKAAKEDLKDFPVAHEDPSGFKIHELKLPEHTPLEGEYVIDEGHFAKYGFKNPEGVITHREYNQPDIEAAVQRQAEQNAYAKLDKALKNEGEQMGHCVGGYTESVAKGRTRIFSLRDPKGGAHATVEVRPHLDTDYNPKNIPEDIRAKIEQYATDETNKAGYKEGTETWYNHHTGVVIQENSRYLRENPKLTLNVEQIKGKGNGAVSEKYRGYIKDWLNKESDKIGRVEDIHNVGLVDLNQPRSLITELEDMYGKDGIHLYNAAVDANPNIGTRFVSREDLRNYIEKPPEPEPIPEPEPESVVESKPVAEPKPEPIQELIDPSKRRFLGLGTRPVKEITAKELQGVSPIEFLAERLLNSPVDRRGFLEKAGKALSAFTLKSLLPDLSLFSGKAKAPTASELNVLQGYTNVIDFVEDAIDEGSFIPSTHEASDVIDQLMSDPESFGLDADVSKATLGKIADLLTNHGFTRSGNTLLPEVKEPPSLSGLQDEYRDVLKTFRDEGLHTDVYTDEMIADEFRGNSDYFGIDSEDADKVDQIAKLIETYGRRIQGNEVLGKGKSIPADFFSPNQAMKVPQFNFDAVAVSNLKKPVKVYHASDAEPMISTNEERLIPGSMSTNINSPNYAWGEKAYSIEIPKGAKVGKLKNIEDLNPKGADVTRMDLGKALREYATENDLDAVFIKNVQGTAGEGEWAIFNPDYIKGARHYDSGELVFQKKEKVPEIIEQKMLQGIYRGYAGENPASGQEGSIYASPQRAVGEYYANKRAKQTGEEPHLEMLLVDPFKGREYGHATAGTGKQLPLVTRARELTPEEIKSSTKLYATGGLIQSFEGGGKVEPVSPSSSVNDYHKPVEPVKKIHNPDAPEFKDMFIRERAIRGGTQSGGPSADIKQIMNPRNIVYKKGGEVAHKPVYFAETPDAMRYELLRNK